MLSSEIEQLKAYFLAKIGGVLNGAVKPDVTDTHDLGTSSQRWNVIYAKSVVADTVVGGSGGGDANNADTIDYFHAAQNPIPNYLLALDPQGIFPISVYPDAILKDGSRALEGSLTVVAGATIDGVDIGSHTHSGLAGDAPTIDHGTLTGLDADDHPQYTQRAQDEIITGDWMFTHLIDRSAGWQFLPDVKQFRAVPHNFIMTADANKASIDMGSLVGGEYGISIYDDNTTPATYVKIGRANDVIYLSATDASYTMWAGHATAASAPFRLSKAGAITASAGTIGGWSIDSSRIYSNNLELHNGGRIVAGTDNAIVKIDAMDATWRLWAGNSVASAAPFRVNKTGQLYMSDAFVTGTLKSQNFISGQSGFSLDSSGLAEFDNIIARGRINAFVLAENTISVASGKTIISDGSVLQVDVDSADGFIVVDNPVFRANDIIRLKPATDRDEYMKVTSSAQAHASGFLYYVVRGLNSSDPLYTGPYDFYVGENAVRLGSAVQTNVGYPMAAGEAGGEFGEYQPGGSGSSTGGGYLILEGSRDFGPFFGVAARYGPVYDQILDVVRIGNLNGVLDYVAEEWGAMFGDSNDYMTYDQTNGLRITTREGATQINNSGIATDAFALIHEDVAPAYVQNQAKIWFDNTPTFKLKVRMKLDTTETDTEIMLASVYDTDGDGKVNNADQLDGHDTSYFATASHAHGISDLSDFAITAAAAGDYLRHNGTDWVDVAVSQVLTDIKTVDGAGSGLDADTLDGLHASSFSSVPVGTVAVLAHTTIPSGWLECNGQAVSRTTYSALFALLGTYYGAGDGSTTFNVPNLKGRVIVGWDTGQTEFDSFAETGGAKTHTLTTAEMPSHRHDVHITSGPGGAQNTNVAYSAAGGITMTQTDDIQLTGGGGAHNNLQPYMALIYMIKT